MPNRIGQEHQGIEPMLPINGMRMGDIELIASPCADDRYNDSTTMGPPADLSIDPWLTLRGGHDRVFRPLESALGRESWMHAHAAL